MEKTHTTPYYPQANGIVKRNNRQLGDSLRALLLRRGQDEWDNLLPQLMRACRATPHLVTWDTANMLMFGRELRLASQLQDYSPSNTFDYLHEYVASMKDRLDQAYEELRQLQLNIRQEDQEEPPLFTG